MFGRLSENERRVLAATGLNADLSLVEAAQRAGLSVSSARQILRSMIDRGVIEARNYINVFQLNLSSYVMLFSLNAKNNSIRSKLIDSLCRLPGVVWFAEVGGDYEFVMNICQGNVHRFIQQLDRIGARFGNIFANKAIAQHFSYRDYSYGFLTPENFEFDFVGTSAPSTYNQFDETDHRLLQAIAALPMNPREVARRLGLPSSTIQYRVERLRKIGVLKRTIYVLNHSALGFNSALFLLYANTSSAAFRERLHNFCLRHPNVITLTESIGAWDFEISAIAQSSDDLRVLRDNLFGQFSDQLNSISCLPCYRLIKWNQYPFDTFEQYTDSISQRFTPQEMKVSVEHDQTTSIAGALKWARTPEVQGPPDNQVANFFRK